MSDVDLVIEAAGVIFLTPEGLALFLLRSGGGDHAGEWALPGGKIEPGETPAEAAFRECSEEIGDFPDDEFIPLMRATSDDGVEFTTFVCPVDEQFAPTLDFEHDDWVWAPADDPPQPLHPALQSALDMVVGMAEDEDMAEDAFDPSEPRNENGEWTAGGDVPAVPAEPGSTPIPEGYVRLYHQTGEENLERIRKEGIRWDMSKGIEGPRAIYADEKGFYGKPDKTPTVEFAVPKDRWDAPFVTKSDVAPGEIIAIHHPWEARARYIEKNPKVMAQILAGKRDNLLGDSQYGPAIRYIKARYGKKQAQDAYNSGEPRDSSGEWTSGGGRSKGVPNYEELMAKVRALEGTRAALKDPQTGKIYTGSTHGAAYRSAPPDVQERMKPYIYDGNFAKARIAGFLDDNDKWMRRDEAEAKYGVYNGGSAEGQRRERNELQSTIAQFHAQDAFDPSEPRDQSGEWTSGGGSMKATAAHPQAQHVQQQQASALLASKVKAMPKTQDERVSMAMKLAKEEGVDDAIAKVSAKVQQLTPTDAPVSKGGFKNDDGTWASSRQALHQNILRDLFTDEAVRNATPAPGADPTLTVLGGRGGSGKSWLTSGQGPVDRSKSIVIDADDFKRLLGSKGWDASAYHEESSYLAETAMKFAMDHHLNVVLDATMKTGSTAAKRLMQFSNAGYDLDGYYMFAPPEVAVRRAYRRFKSGGETGRYVPGDVILSNTDNEKNFDSVLPMFKKWAVYDGSEDGPPKLFSKSMEKADGKAA